MSERLEAIAEQADADEDGGQAAVGDEGGVPDHSLPNPRKPLLKSSGGYREERASEDRHGEDCTDEPADESACDTDGGEGVSGDSTPRGSRAARRRPRRRGPRRGRKDSQEPKPDEPKNAITLELYELDPAFHLQAALIGEHGRNMLHIREEAGAGIWLHGAVGAPSGIRFHLRARDQDTLDKAVHITNDLINTVLDQYKEWSRGRGHGEC